MIHSFFSWTLWASVLLLTVPLVFSQEKPAPDKTPPTGQELVQKMVDYRKSVKEGYVIVNVKWPIHYAPPYQGSEATFKFYWNNDSLRNDSILKFPTNTVTQQIVKTPRMNFSRSGASKVPCRYDDDPEQMYEPKQTILPMVLGTLPQSINAYSDIKLTFEDISLCPPKGIDFQVVYDQLEGTDTWKVTYRIESDLVQIFNTYWIAPQMGYTLIRFESRQKNSQNTVDIDYNLKPKQYGQFWFPEEMRYQLKYDGKVTKEEIQTVQKAVFNQPVDAKEFTLTGFDLPSGIEIVVNGQYLKYWDGKDISDFPYYPLPESPTKGRRWSFILSINAILLAFIAFHFYRRYQRSKTV